MENILERALIYAEGDAILAADLDFAGRSRIARTDFAGAEPSRASLATGPESSGVDTSLDSVEKVAIERALAKQGGNRTKAAQELGISRRTILNKIKKYGLD